MLIREMRREEYGLLADFLYEAIFQPEGVERLPKKVIFQPELRRYICDFGERRGDVCVCAEIDGDVVGAAWSRLMRGYGYLADDVPELSAAVVEAHRGQGIGTKLMSALRERLLAEGFSRASLSVQRENPALRLYERLGMTAAREDETELVMVWEL